MHGFTLSIPLGTEVGLLLVPKGRGVQVGVGLMAIGPWTVVAQNRLKVVGQSTGLGAGPSVTSAKAIPQAGSPTGLTFGSSSSSGHLSITLGSKFPRASKYLGWSP